MKEFFTVINETTDISNDMSSFSRDEVDFLLTAAQTLHVGFRKAFALAYFELSTPNTTPAILNAFYDIEGGTKTLDIIDETKGFTRSGFIKFTRPTDMVSTSEQGIEKNYIHIKTDADMSVGTKIKGVGIVFCNNQDLIDIRSNVISKLNGGNSLISKIALARDHIIDEMNQQGNVKIVKDSSLSVSGGVVLSEINEFDFLKIDQLRIACAYQALGHFFLEEKSDKADDKWEVQGKRFMEVAGRRVESYLLNLDLDDDGEVDDSELNATTTISLSLD